MQNTLITQAIIASATGFVVQLAKALNINIKGDFLPILSVCVGVIGNLLFVFVSETGFKDMSIINIIFAGAMSGFMASGAYDAFKQLPVIINKD